ncbi:hypothetical protein AAG906_036642 [Vitis piasezkii]|uniref:18 kDa seed maturation protein n=2 Tax=Vitis vinifera TaxID=29760 RepID=A5BCB0_VITVI|eukprot:XP_002279196.1 PREDICTED: 11 kDa late embryogenesis abundant protein [Vitis vinifera]
MESVKEKAANVAASAKAGMEKTKATVQEKVEKLTAHGEMEKQIATQKKEEKKADAEIKKQEAYENNAAGRQAAAVGGEAHYTAGPGQAAVPAGTTYSAATGVPGRPIGINPGTGGALAQNPRVEGGGAKTGYGTGGNYT